MHNGIYPKRMIYFSIKKKKKKEIGEHLRHDNGLGIS